MAHRLCGPPVIVFEDSTEPLATLDSAALTDRTARFLDQLIVEALVIALQVVVLRIFLDGLAKVALAQRNAHQLSVLSGLHGVASVACPTL